MTGNKIKAIYSVLLLFCLLTVAAAEAQLPAYYGPKEGGFDFQVDYAQFRGEQPGKTRVEVYYRVFNSNLQFIKGTDGYSAAYEMVVTVQDNDGKQLNAFSRDRSIAVTDYKRTVSPEDFRTSQISFDIPPGKYKFVCTMTDKNSHSRLGKTIKAEIIKFNGKSPRLSGIEFARVVDTTASDSLFAKGKMNVIPSVGREFGGDSAGALLYYMEIYKGSGDRKDVKLETQILNRRMDAVYRDTLTTVFKDDEVVRQLRRISLSGMRAGSYTLEITMKGRRDVVEEDVREPFLIFWSPEALVRNDFAAAVAQVKYIATSGEMKAFKKASTPEERLKLWNEFWEKRDPTPETGVNEFRREYYSRIEYANEHFSILRKEGWLTDRGMIFITYGEPDQIEDFPFELDSKAYQIWDYYRANDVRRFLFVDEWSDGDYRLQYPYDGRQ